ncbi:ferric reductase like transmembrane component-domain-containing protein [Mycena belliarum]|uniref:Ferric reductase like transmembrane component-domain-containing protein n=1 Tax=Mycena belliarum TaxID=1033014 RepID=A0AAD6XU92_9AGAR|nr:ferric reductase like transmembrane component-domain-containing protein [Mycena belliae]
MVFGRLFRPHRKNVGDGNSKQSFLYRSTRSAAALSRKHLLPESFPRLFPNTSRLQVLILAILTVYLTIFTFIGIVYKRWETPNKGTTRMSIRTGLGGFSNRVGVLAFALTPLTVALCSRDSMLSLLTGIPYQHFNFLHRWTGRIILIQSSIHTIAWTIVEARLYQPQPDKYLNFMKETYAIWGVVAQGFITFLFVFSFRPVIRWTGYEFFKKSHLIVAGLHFGACWGHWHLLACWMIASLGILGIELGMRTLRVCLIHMGYKDGSKGFGFRSINSKVEVFKDPSGTIVRMTYTHNHEPWKIGQHFYLTFPALSIWQSHPFTPASVPPTSMVPPSHVYIIRARDGETGKLGATETSTSEKNDSFETPVIMVGPYGRSTIDREATNILAIAGGTGISFTLPTVLSALADPTSITQNIEMIWIIRHIDNLAWIGPELTTARSYLSDSSSDPKSPTPSITHPKRFRIRIYVTRAPETRTHVHPRPGTAADQQPPKQDLEISSVSSNEFNPTHTHEIRDLIAVHPAFSIEYLDHARPSVDAMLTAFMDDTVDAGSTQVLGSGPAALGTDIRAGVARWNDAGRVWRGDERGDVRCVWDDRMG